MYGRSRSIPMAYPWFGPGAKHRKAIRSFLSHSSERIWGHPSQVLVKSALLGFTVLLSAGGIARSPRFKIIPHDCILLPVVGKEMGAVYLPQSRPAHLGSCHTPHQLPGRRQYVVFHIICSFLWLLRPAHLAVFIP